MAFKTPRHRRTLVRTRRLRFMAWQHHPSDATAELCAFSSEVSEVTDNQIQFSESNSHSGQAE